MIGIMLTEEFSKEFTKNCREKFTKAFREKFTEILYDQYYGNCLSHFLYETFLMCIIRISQNDRVS